MNWMDKYIPKNQSLFNKKWLKLVLIALLAAPIFGASFQKPYLDRTPLSPIKRPAEPSKAQKLLTIIRKNPTTTATLMSALILSQIDSKIMGITSYTWMKTILSFLPTTLMLDSLKAQPKSGGYAGNPAGAVGEGLLQLAFIGAAVSASLVANLWVNVIGPWSYNLILKALLKQALEQREKGLI